MTTNQPRTIGVIIERIIEKCIKRSALFGLIEWHEVVSATHAGYDLHINTVVPATRVFLNGELITLNDTI